MKKLFVSIMMAFVMLFTCVITPIAATSVQADPPNSYFDTVHYVTNNPNANSYRSSLLANPQRNPFITDIQVYYYGPTEDDFRRSFLDFVMSEGDFLSGSTDSGYLILELTNGFDYNVDNDQKTVLAELLADRLDEFDDWDVMFICGTEESRWQYYNEFLDYVDFHVNTGVLDIFTLNIFYRIEQALGDSPTNTMYIFDSWFSDGVDFGAPYLNSWFFKNYLLPYFRMQYQDELVSYGFLNYALLQDKGIEFICHLGDNFFLDGVTGEMISEQELLQERLPNAQNICAIGSSIGERYNDSTTWVQMVIDWRDTTGRSFPIYVMDYNGFYTTDSASEFYVVGLGNAYFYMSEFLRTDANLEIYHNYNGRCIISHQIALLPSENGWLIDVYGLYSYYISAWAIYQDATTNELCFGYNDVWP